MEPYAPGGTRVAPVDVEHRQRGGARRGYSGGGYEMQIPGVGGAPRSGFTVGLPTVQRPPFATDFNMFGTVAGLTAATTPAELASEQIPPNRVAVIRAISILANGLLTTSDIIWTLRYNGSAVQGWNELTINPRAAGSVEVSWTPEETYIPVPEGSLVTVDATVRDGGTYQLSVAIHGWHYSSALDAIAAAAYPR